MKIGVVSDTHGFFDPRLKKLLAGVEAIVHGGDVGSGEVLRELRQIAPVSAVRGNVDPPDSNLPPSLTVAFQGLHVEVIHLLPVPQSELEAWAEATSPEGKAPQRSDRFLKTFDESTGVVVFGHSHQPCLVKLGERLFFNPGSAGKKRFSLPRCCGLLEIAPGEIRASIQLLEKYNGPIPPGIRMDFEE